MNGRTNQQQDKKKKLYITALIVTHLSKPNFISEISIGRLT